MKNKNLIKRLTLGSALGVFAGFLCFLSFSLKPDMPAELAQYQVWSWGNFMMWSTVANRFVVGLMVAIAGFITTYPCFGFKLPTFVRGAKIGALISLPMALGTLINSVSGSGAFWIVLIAGVIIGSVIDMIITKLAGDGNALY